jgi:hypothetical protein
VNESQTTPHNGACPPGASAELASQQPRPPSDLEAPVTRHPSLPRRLGDVARRGRPLAAALLLGLTTALTAGLSVSLAAALDAAPDSATRSAIAPPSTSVRDDDAHRFTLGILTDVDDDQITIRLQNGESRTFQLDNDTVIRSQDGDGEDVDDLDVGEMVVVVTDDDDDTAVSIMEGSPTGFRSGGPYDLRDRLGPGGRWRQQAAPDHPPSFAPGQPGSRLTTGGPPMPLGPDGAPSGPAAGPGPHGALPPGAMR